MSVLFQWVDGGILRQFQLRKNTDRCRKLMADLIETQQSIANEEQTGQNATNDCVGQPTESVRAIAARNTQALDEQRNGSANRPSRRSYQRIVQKRQIIERREDSAVLPEQQAEEDDPVDYQLHAFRLPIAEDEQK